MKNLKKVLALVMVFAMMATAMFSAAAFNDDADIEATTAVNTLSALSVINGYEDGSFKPNGTVTRAEMAAMIYIIRNGGKTDASGYANLPTSFTDLGNAKWAEGFIKHAQTMGIISGRSDTVFDPNAQVTGVEAALMCLRSAGYDAAKAGIGGATWSSTTLALANEAGLLDGVQADLNAALPRQWAAQLLYNLLDVDCVTWSNDSESFEETNRGGTPYGTVGEKYMDLKKATGTLLYSGKNGLEDGAENGLKIDIDVDDENNLDENNRVDVKDTFTNVYTDYSALLGQKVEVLYKVQTNKTTVYGVFAHEDNQVVINTVASELDKVSGETKVEVDGTKYSVDTTDGMTIYTVKADTTSTKVTKTYTALKTASAIATAIDAINDDDMLVTVISNNDDSKIDTIIKYEATFAQISAANSSSVSYKKVDVSTMKGDTTGAATKLDFEDDAPTIYDDYAKDDYVFVSADLFNDAVVIEKADTISGKTAAVKSDSVRIGDTWYDFAGSFSAEASKEYIAYVYGGYIYYLDGTSGGDVDTLVVKNVGEYKTLDGGVETKVIFDDGTEKIINVTKVDSTDMTATSSKPAKQTLYAYDEDDGDYELKTINASYVDGDNKGHVLAAGSGYNSDKETIDGNDFTDGASIFVIYKNASGDTKYKVITGSALSGYDNLYNASTISTAYVTNDDDDVIAALINLDATLKTADTVYGVVTSAYIATNDDGDDVVYLDLITADGQYKGIETEETSNKNSNGTAKFAKGDIVSYTGDYTKANGDVEIISDSSTDATSSVDTSKGYGAINKYNSSSKLVTFRNAVGTTGYSISNDTSCIWLTNKLASAKIVSDTQIIYVDMSESTWTAEDGTPTTADEFIDETINATYPTSYYANAFAVINKDGEFDLLVIEVGDNQILANDSNNTRKDVVFLTQ